MADRLGSLLPDEELTNRLAEARDQARDARERADAAAKNIALAAERGVDKLQAVGQEIRATFAEAADELRRGVDDLLKSSTTRLENRVDEMAELLEPIRASQTSLMEEANSKLSATARASLEALTKEAKTIAEQVRTQVQAMLEEHVVNSGRQLRRVRTAAGRTVACRQESSRYS